MTEDRFDKSLRFQLSLFTLLIISSMISCMILNSTSTDVNIEFPDDPRVDQSFVSGQPCKAPCWYGLELGEAGVEDIQTTLSSLPFIDSASIGTQKFSSGTDELLFFADCVYSEPDKDCVLLETSPEGKLRKVILDIYYPLTVEAAIRQLGKPTYYISDPISGKDACTIHIYWPDASVSAILEVAPKERYCIGGKSEKVNLGDQIELLIYTTIEDQQGGTPWTVDQ